jgi:hypothetical protein
MDSLFILLIIIGAIYWFFSKSSSSKKKVKTPNITVSVSTNTSSASGGYSRDIPNSGEVQQSPDGGWIINPKSSFPLTLLDIDKDTAIDIKKIIDSHWSNYDRESKRKLVAIAARSNLRCKEIEDYVNKYKPKYEKVIDNLKNNHSEWADASELDKKDLLIEFQEQAIKSLDMLPCGRVDNFPVIALFHDQPEDATIDDALIDRYGFELINYYFRYADKLDKVHRIQADHYGRKTFESLVDAGLAQRGASIPVEHLLSSLRLKDMNEMIKDPDVKPFKRKAQAIEYLAQQSDISEILSKQMSFRELFQLLPLPEEFAGIDLDAVSKSWSHAEAVADILFDTYEGGLSHLDEKESVRGFGPDIIGWEIFLDNDAPAYCKKVADKAKTTKRIPKLPAHIGCSCNANPIYKD